MLVGSLNWLVTLGWYDIQHATQTLAQYSSIPREGHLKATKQIFRYVKSYAKVAIRYVLAMPDFAI